MSSQTESQPQVSLSKNEFIENIDKFTESINEISNDFRTSILNKFFEMKTFCQRQGDAEKQEIIDKKDDEIAQQQTQIEKLQERIVIRDHYLQKFKELTFRMADQISYVRKIEKQKMQLRRILFNWDQMVKESKRKKRKLKRAQKHYEIRLSRKILHQWYVWAIKKRRQTNELAWESRLQAGASKIRNDYNAHLAELTSELEETKRRLRLEQKDKVVLQENLKKALMRGVCAMNNKFLDIIKDANQNANFVEQQLPEQQENIQPNRVQPTNIPNNQRGVPNQKVNVHVFREVPDPNRVYKKQLPIPRPK